MNYIAIIQKNLNGLESAWKGISTDETRTKAKDMILASVERMDVMPKPAPIVTVTVTPPVAAEAYEPITELPLSIDTINGWPMECKAKVIGLFPNRRKLKAALEDGRAIALERKPGIQSGSAVRARIVLGGNPPLYRVV